MVINLSNTLLYQWGKHSLSGNIGGSKNKSYQITLNYSYTNTSYAPIAIHMSGNQMNATLNDTKTVSTFETTLRNINSNDGANVVAIIWHTIGY